MKGRGDPETCYDAYVRHHYVPRFLLRPWADSTPDGKIEVFRLDLDDLRSSRHTPKYTGYEEDLYALSMPVVAGMEKQAIEKHFLRHVDNLAARVHRKLDEKGLQALTLEDRSDWVRFLMSLRPSAPSPVADDGSTSGLSEGASKALSALGHQN